MSKSIIATEKAPAAIGPYVQATKLGDLVFTSGQIPLIPETMQLVTGDIKIQAEQVLRNLSAILEAAGASTATVMKTTCFLKDMNDFVAFNEVYAQFLMKVRLPVHVLKLLVYLKMYSLKLKRLLT